MACENHESGVVTIEAGLTVVSWCSSCGAVRDNNGDHGAEEAAAPTLYCDCSEEERAKWKVDEQERRENCGHVRANG